MSVSGPGGVGAPRVDPDLETPPAETTETSSTPATPPARTPPSSAPAADPAAAALLAQLRGVAVGARPSLPGWLSWLDGDSNVRELGRRAIEDGNVTAAEVERLVRGAYDFGRMSGGEKQALLRLLNEHAAKFEPAARQALADFLGVPNPLPGAGPAAPAAPTAPTAPATPATPTPPAAPAAEPRASDIVPAAYLEKYGLDPNKLKTESRYDGPQWNVGYFPYFGDVQYISFAKHNLVFGGDAAADAHGWFEHYANPPTGLSRGSWIASGSIRESDFEASTGIDVSGDRPIDNAAYKLLREAGAPASAKFALRDASGKQIPVREGDRLVPAAIRNGRPVELEVDGDGRYRAADGTPVDAADVVWRLKSRTGEIRYQPGDRAEDRATLAGASGGVKFDFLDATGRLVAYSPARDRIVQAYAEGEKWHVFARGAGTPPSYEHQVIGRDGRVERTEQLSEAQAKDLMRGKDVIHRVQNRSTGALAGDGKVSETYDMSWWGKCHNVASIGTSNMPRAKDAVKVVTNLEAGDTAALRWGDSVLRPIKDASGKIAKYALETRAPGGGAVVSTREVSVEEAARLAEANKATAVIVRRDGSLKEAAVATFSPKEVDALVSHMGDGAVVYKGSEGARYYAMPDVIALKDGREVHAYIKSISTASGKTEEIGSRSGHDYYERDRAPLRAPGMTSRTIGDGTGRRYAFNFVDMKDLNRYREDDVKKITVIHPDGREEVIDAADVDMIAWENKFDFRPDQLWGLHKTVGKDGSTVIERDPGTHVWNYTINSVDTQPLRPESLSAAERERAKLPGMMAGTVGDANKYFFETKVDGTTYRYWVRFDNDGKVADYAYLNDSVPDFVWTQHVKDPWKDRWTGESQAPGVKNADVQRLYLASLGGFSGQTLPGGFIAAPDLKTATPVRP